MPYDFPPNPALDDELFGYKWDGTMWVVLGAPGTGDAEEGDSLETTPVAAYGSTVEQTIPLWLAGAPIISVDGECFIAPDHRGAWVYLTNAVGTLIYLPDDWQAGWTFGARQIGTGPVQWVVTGGASMQVPYTKFDHSGILEQYEEVIFRVISNTGGNAAVWSFSGASG